jgi:hypothetical protein
MPCLALSRGSSVLCVYVCVFQPALCQPVSVFPGDLLPVVASRALRCIAQLWGGVGTAGQLSRLSVQSVQCSVDQSTAGYQ